MHAEDILQTSLGPIHATSVSVRSYEICSVILESLVFLGPSSLLSSVMPSAPLHQDSLTFEGRDFMETYCLGLCVLRLLSLHKVLLLVSVLFSHLLQEQASLIMVE